jgi:hypothetical protein
VEWAQQVWCMMLLYSFHSHVKLIMYLFLTNVHHLKLLIHQLLLHLASPIVITMFRLQVVLSSSRYIPMFFVMISSQFAW